MKKTIHKPTPRYPWNKTVYVVVPVEHGNGGWCGSRVLKTCQLRTALRVDPVKRFLYGYFEPHWINTSVRICLDKNPNTPIYIWDHEGGTGWNKV